MPFGSNSLTATIMNNTFRGLHRDFTDNAVAAPGDTNEATMGSVSVTGGTITATGTLYFFACGTVTGGTETKQIRVDFGGTDILNTTAKSGTADWYVKGWIMNTATNAQRIYVEWSDVTNATNFNMDYTTATIDTTAAATLAVTSTFGTDGSDTTTMTIFMLDIQQIT